MAKDSGKTTGHQRGTPSSDTVGAQRGVVTPVSIISISKKGKVRK